MPQVQPRPRKRSIKPPKEPPATFPAVLLRRRRRPLHRRLLRGRLLRRRLGFRRTARRGGKRNGDDGELDRACEPDPARLHRPRRLRRRRRSADTLGGPPLRRRRRRTGWTFLLFLEVSLFFDHAGGGFWFEGFDVFLPVFFFDL